MVTLHLSCSPERKIEASKLLAKFGYEPQFIENWALCQSSEPSALFILGLYAGRGSFYSGWITEEFLEKRRPVIVVHGDNKSNELINRLNLPMEKIRTGELQMFTWSEYDSAVAGRRYWVNQVKQALRNAISKAEEVQIT